MNLIRRIACILLLSFCGHVNAQAIYVNLNATGANNGSSWGNAYTTLSPALASATAGSVIWVAAGTYTPTTTSDRNVTFLINSGVKVYGGFAGNETSLSARNFQSNITVLSGNIGNAASNLDNSIHVAMMLNCDTATTLDGFTISDGYAGIRDSVITNGIINYRSKGAGLYIYGGQPKVANCIFSGHTADFGGGMYLYADSSVITKTIFTTNDCTHGSGLMALKSKSVFDSCMFSNNAAWLGGGCGGGIYDDSSSLKITRCTFKGNSATSGGGIYSANGTPVVDSCMFEANIAFHFTQFYAYGGGIYNYYSDAIIRRCLFRKNNSGSGDTRGFGGGIYNDHCDPVITLCTLDSNYAYGGGTTSLAGMGGGIFSNAGTPLIYNCLFIDNMAKYPNGTLAPSGGLQNNYSNAVVSNCTFYMHGNPVSIYHLVNQYGDPKTYNCILWNVGSDPILNYYHVKNCIVEGATPDPVNKVYNSDPMFNNPAANDFSIGKCSPALNTGDNGLYPGAIGTDNALQLNQRLQDGVIDIGAYESPYKTAGFSATLQDAVSCGLSPAFFHAAIKGDSIDSYTWQVKQGTGGFIDLPPGSKDTLYIQSPAANMNGWQYRLIVRACNGILSDSSNAAILKVVPLPQPVIVRGAGDVLHTGSFLNYQWYKDSVLIPGATTDSFSLLQNGSYYVYVTDTNGCGGYSATDTITNVSVTQLDALPGIKVFPNPAITYIRVTPQHLNLIITDILGVVLYNGTDVSTVDISNLANGTYYYHVYNNDKTPLASGIFQKL